MKSTVKKSLIIDLIYEGQQMILREKGVKRNIEDLLYSSMQSKPIKIVTGFRRSGKSFLLRQIAARAIQENIYKIDNVLYLNFEDYRLEEVTSATELAEVYKIFLNDVAKSGKKLIILDEIQLINKWDKFLRTIYEKVKDTELIITGSNSELLSSELGSHLAGRFIEFFLLPFSFNEFLIYKNITINEKSDFYRQQDHVEKLFLEFLKYGGLPEVFEINLPEVKQSFLKGIVSKVILDDIVKRFRVTNIVLIELLIHYVLANSGRKISYTKIVGHLSNMGLTAKPNTIIKYVHYLTKTFSTFSILRFNWKISRIFSSMNKFYCVDTGILHLFRGEDFESFALENVVYLQHLRKNKKIFYGLDEKSKEIDFLVEKKSKLYDKYQVTMNLTSKNEYRELGNFKLITKYLEKGENFLLSYDRAGKEIIYDGVKINKVNLIEWLLFY